MAKELGQIHTVNKSVSLNATVVPTLIPAAVLDVDLPAELTEQLQRLVRAGNFFKTVGIDISLDAQGDQNLSCTVSGSIRYYAPTRGRCAAFRGAFKAMADAMKMQGISMRDNHMYDFKAPINPDLSATFRNLATLDGTNGLAMNNAANPGAGIFQVHNTSVKPTYEGTLDGLYSEGFDTVLASGVARTDFVLQESIAYTGNENIASVDYESIPFMLSYSTTADEHSTATFQFRPDPALYIAVLCGQFQVYLEDFDVNNGIVTDNIDLNISVMTSGWKSVMGSPDKKSSKKMSSNRKRK